MQAETVRKQQGQGRESEILRRLNSGDAQLLRLVQQQISSNLRADNEKQTKRVSAA